MTLSDTHATEYYVTTYWHTLSERQQWYRFFERAAFSPSPDMFDNKLGYVDAQGLPKPHESFGDWIEEQNALPATLHCEYFRKQFNPRSALWAAHSATSRTASLTSSTSCA